VIGSRIQAAWAPLAHGNEPDPSPPNPGPSQGIRMRAVLTGTRWMTAPGRQRKPRGDAPWQLPGLDLREAMVPALPRALSAGSGSAAPAWTANAVRPGDQRPVPANVAALLLGAAGMPGVMRSGSRSCRGDPHFPREAPVRAIPLRQARACDGIRARSEPIEPRRRDLMRNAPLNGCFRAGPGQAPGPPSPFAQSGEQERGRLRLGPAVLLRLRSLPGGGPAGEKVSPSGSAGDA
jgi:hypothetical protein